MSGKWEIIEGEKLASEIDSSQPINVSAPVAAVTQLMNLPPKHRVRKNENEETYFAERNPLCFHTNAEIEAERNFLSTISLLRDWDDVCKLKIVHLNVKQEIIHKHKTYARQSRRKF